MEKETYKWVSGIPLFGSFLVALSLLHLYTLPGLLPLAAGIILADTGGIHWVIGTMIYYSLYGNKNG